MKTWLKVAVIFWAVAGVLRGLFLLGVESKSASYDFGSIIAMGFMAWVALWAYRSIKNDKRRTQEQPTGRGPIV